MLSVNIWTWTLLGQAVSSLCSLESAGLRWSRSCILNRLQEASVDSLQAETHSAKVCSLFTLLCHREAVTCKGYGCTVTPALTFVLTHSKSKSFAALRAHSEITADSGRDRMAGLHRLLQAPPQTWRVQKGWKRRSLNFIQHAHSSLLQHSRFYSANISVSCILYFCAI